MVIKLTNSGITTFLMTLLVFLDMEPYFTWAQIFPFGYTFYTAVILVTTLAMVLLVSKKCLILGKMPGLREKKYIPLSLVGASMGFVVLILYQMFFSGVVTKTAQPFNLAMLCVHIGLMMFCLQDHASLQRVYLVSKKIFAAVLIPAILIYIFKVVGIQLPSVSLSADAGKELTGQSYELYMGVAIMLKNTGEELLRLCGLFREPGFVGTVGALYLLGDKLTLKKWENLVIIVAGVFTFSVAFYVLLVLGILMKAAVSATTSKKLVSVVMTTVLIVSAYLVFMNASFNPSSPFAELQERLVFTEDGLAGDNRMTDEYAISAYEKWAESGTKNVLFGYGEDNRKVPGTDYSIWQNVHSVKEYIFSYGVISLIILVLTLVFSTLAKYRGVKGLSKRYILVLLFIFILSIYQRYGVCKFFYLCVLFGGASNLALTENESISAQSE